MTPTPRQSASPSPAPCTSRSVLTNNESVSLIAQYVPLVRLPDVTQAISTIFGVCAGGVRQQAGRMHGNAGEGLPTDVATLAEAVVPIKAKDVFLDVGAGIDSVIAPVAFTTIFRACKVRGELCSLGERRSRSYLYEFPLLRKVSVVLADTRDAALSTRPPMCEFLRTTVCSKRMQN